MKIPFDKIQHFCLCLIVSVVVTAVVGFLTLHPIASAFAGASCGMALGVGKEYGDKCDTDNFWDWRDIAADALGALVGGSFGLLLYFVH